MQGMGGVENESEGWGKGRQLLIEMAVKRD